MDVLIPSLSARPSSLTPAVLEKVELPGSDIPYLLVPCTYDAGVKCAYKVQLMCDDPEFTNYVSLGPLPDEKNQYKIACAVLIPLSSPYLCSPLSTYR